MNVLVISIGPVQEFIASARKCRDLWFGSWLLSELSRAAAQGLVAASGQPEDSVLVFPGTKLESKELHVANKVVARVEGDVADLARAAERAMRERLREICEAAFKRVGRGVRNRGRVFHEDTARQQVEDLIEFLWAAAPEADEGYGGARAEAERLLAATKASKLWAQPSWAEHGAGVPKSSLDGVRESVLDEALYDVPRGDYDKRLHEEVRGRRRQFGVHGAERLCGVGLLKRFGNYEDPQLKDGTARIGDERGYRIFSTTHVASAPFRAGLDAIAGDAAFARYLERLEQLCDQYELKPWELEVAPAKDPVTGYVDGAIFYAGRLADEIEEIGGDEATVNAATKALAAFLGEVRQLGEPIPYYAIVLADGDNMGAAINDCQEQGRHRDLSHALETFATGARALVSKHGGRLIYSGGDDVLGLVPLHRLLDCVSGLEGSFGDTMRPYSAKVDGERRSPTLSVGVAIVHALDALDQSLELTREAERCAKAVAGKNGLALLVKPRGGAVVRVSGAFEREHYVERLRQLIQLHRADLLSARTQYELMDVAARLVDDEPVSAQRRETLDQIARAETRRLLARKRAAHGQEKLAEEVLDTLEGFGAFDDPQRLGRELYVASHVARALDQAEPARAQEQEAAQ